MKFISAAIVISSLAGCAVSPSPQGVSGTARIVATEHTLKRFKKLGISLELPGNVIDLDTNSNREYQRGFGCTSVSFQLMRLAPRGSESGPLMWGEVQIYDPQQEITYQKEKFNSQGYKAYVGVENRRITKCDTVVKLDTPLTNRFGYRQKIYRLDHKDKASGKAFRASIVRASYADNPAVNQSDEALITRIMKSIRFE
jgi:hypothetical protein